jgi:hypothetical protein
MPKVFKLDLISDCVLYCKFVIRFCFTFTFCLLSDKYFCFRIVLFFVFVFRRLHRFRRRHVLARRARRRCGGRRTAAVHHRRVGDQ